MRRSYENEERADEAESAGRLMPVWQIVFLALLLVAATVAAYQPVWHAGFIWDDDIYVTTNKLLSAPDGLWRIWFSFDSPSQYFPLTYTTLWVEHRLWGLNPVGYHWVNLALHAANALLLWRLLSRLRIPGAWLGAALFALHPVQVESVAWISERKNVLMGFFFLLTLLVWRAFVAGKRRGEFKLYLLALLCYVLALAAKTTACTLPAALLLILWLKRGSIRAVRIVHVMPFVLLGLGAGLLTIWWEKYHQGTEGQLFALGIQERLLVAARAFWFYLEKLAWPVDLAFSYPRWTLVTGQLTDYAWAGGCLLLVLFILILRRWVGRGPEVAVLYFVATLAPVLGFIMLYTFRYSFVADHYQYLAAIGPFALVAAGLTTALRPLGRAQRVLLPIFALALLGWLGFGTWRQSAIYENEEKLWRATLAVNPASWMAQNNLAILLLHRGETEQAIKHFEEALRLDPNYAEGHYNLGNALFRLGRMDEARAHYERALQLFPEYALAHHNLAILLLQTGESAAAIEHLEAAVRMAPRFAESRQLLGQTLLQAGRNDEGVAQLQAALEIEPDSVTAREALAAANLKLGRRTEVKGEVKPIAEGNPTSAAAEIEAGRVALSRFEPKQAAAHFERALQIDPKNARAHYFLGNSFLDRRQVEVAMEHFREAVTLKPDYVPALVNLGNTLLETGRNEEARGGIRKGARARSELPPGASKPGQRAQPSRTFRRSDGTHGSGLEAGSRATQESGIARALTSRPFVRERDAEPSLRPADSSRSSRRWRARPSVFRWRGAGHRRPSHRSEASAEECTSAKPAPRR